MSSSAPFVLRYAIEGSPFAAQFMASDDFDKDILSNICRDLNLLVLGKKGDLIQRISVALDGDRTDTISRVVLQNMLARNRTWFSFYHGQVSNFPRLEDPIQLLLCEGEQTWYGPITDNRNATWYLRSSFFVHWEIDDTTKEPIRRQIRWLFFARVMGGIVSFHWQGMSISEDEVKIEHTSQFPYWLYVSKYVDEFARIVKVKLTPPNLQNLVLFNLWERYRLNKNFNWADLRIRAESGGVVLNARSSISAVDIDIRGINHLADTLANAVQVELRENDLELPDHKRMKEKLLGTLILDFGPKSYEFSLKSTADEPICRVHVYFGSRINFPGPDSLPHVKCLSSYGSDVEQLEFLLENI